MPQRPWVDDLTHDISYAVFRVAALVGHEYLRRELEAAAVELVKSANEETIGKLLRIIRLAEALGEMNQLNAGVLCRELDNLQNLFSEDSEIHSEISELFAESEKEPIFSEITTLKASIEGRKLSKNALERQDAIFQLIRKFPNGCRMRDLAGKFPDYTDRTIRNDVQRLAERGLVKRFGSKSGPLSYVKAIGLTLDSRAELTAEQASRELAEPPRN